MSFVPATLRDYRKSDLEAIFQLDQVCFSQEFRFDRESMQAFAESRSAVSLIAEDDGGRLAGFIIVQIERRTGVYRGYVITIDVVPLNRRKGLAARLLGDAEVRVKETGAEWMELHVFAGNEGAIRFYERLGYARVAERRGFYGADGLDAFVYRKALRDM